MNQDKLNKILEDHKIWLATNGVLSKRADLSGLDLSGTNLRGTNLRFANLRGTNLRGTNLRYADLSRADLSGADLCFADLSRANLSGAIYNDSTILKAYSFVGFGSQNRMTTFMILEDEILVWCGCFHGDLEQFGKQVAETYASDNFHNLEYISMIIMVENLATSVRRLGNESE